MSSQHPKHAVPQYPILAPLAERWSPYVYRPVPVERAKLLSCLEAARWSASSYNDQPWSFLVAERENGAEFERMLGCLVEFNQAWAKHAGVLLIAVAAKNFTHNGQPNAVAEYDVGQAAASLTIQATALGLAVHQMAGIDREKIRQTYHVPATHAPLTALAVGYAADRSSSADAPLAERDATPRTRKPISQFVFTSQWNQALPNS